MILSGGISPRQRSTSDPACTPAGRVFISHCNQQLTIAPDPARTAGRFLFPAASLSRGFSPHQRQPLPGKLIPANYRPPTLSALPQAGFFVPVLSSSPRPSFDCPAARLATASRHSAPASTKTFLHVIPQPPPRPALRLCTMPHARLTLPAYAPLSRRRNLTPPATPGATRPGPHRRPVFVPRRKPLTLPPTHRKRAPAFIRIIGSAGNNPARQSATAFGKPSAEPNLSGLCRGKKGGWK